MSDVEKVKPTNSVSEARVIHQGETKGEAWGSAPSYYVNATNAMINRWDIRLVFSEIMPLSSESVVAVPQCSVVMSPQHAKALHILLGEQIKEYEKTMGELRWEPLTPDQL